MTELEKIGLIPRSIVRMLDRFYYQLYLGTAEPLVKQFRFSKYLLLTSVKSLLLVLFIPFFINIFTKIYIFRPLVEYFWDRKQTEIFLNYELQEKAFSEIKNFEEKMYFDYLIKIDSSFYPNFKLDDHFALKGKTVQLFQKSDTNFYFFKIHNSDLLTRNDFLVLPQNVTNTSIWKKNFNANKFLSSRNKLAQNIVVPVEFSPYISSYPIKVAFRHNISNSNQCELFFFNDPLLECYLLKKQLNTLQQGFSWNSPSEKNFYNFNSKIGPSEWQGINLANSLFFIAPVIKFGNDIDFVSFDENSLGGIYFLENSHRQGLAQFSSNEYAEYIFRQKTRELAEHYNHESIEAITNLFADFMGLIILLFLLINMKMSLMNTTAFLSESFFSLKDSKKAFLMLLFTDLLVGFHSPRGWEVIFHFLFEHFGLPENQNILFLLVGTFPVLLDALFKYWIFRHLNRHSPATVATFQAMVE